MIIVKFIAAVLIPITPCRAAEWLGGTLAQRNISGRAQGLSVDSLMPIARIA